MQIEIALNNVKAYFAITNKKDCTEEEKTKAYNELDNDEKNIVTDYRGLCKSAVNVSKDEENETKLSTELKYFLSAYYIERSVKVRQEEITFDLVYEVVSRLTNDTMDALKTVDM